MASFNFKSSGTQITDRSVTEDFTTKKTRDIGIKTPLQSTQGRQIFDMHTDPADQLKDNLKNLVLTNAGERLGLFSFGADLNSLLFELGSDENVESEMVDRIKSAVQTYLPGVEIREISEVEIDKNEKQQINQKGMTKVRLRIEYDVPSVRITDQALELTLQAGG